MVKEIHEEMTGCLHGSSQVLNCIKRSMLCFCRANFRTRHIYGKSMQSTIPYDYCCWVQNQRSGEQIIWWYFCTPPPPACPKPHKPKHLPAHQKHAHVHQEEICSTVESKWCLGQGHPSCHVLPNEIMFRNLHSMKC